MIEPPFGELTEVKDELPHPAGVIRVQFNRKGGQGILAACWSNRNIFLGRKNASIVFRHANY